MHEATSADINPVALISQPELALAVRVEDCYASSREDAISDSLLHCVEPMLCDVWQVPQFRLHLCPNRHLTCDDSVLCCGAYKREFCKLCEACVGVWAVCNRPLCTQSRIHSQVCGA